MGISFSNVPDDASCTVIFEQEMALGDLNVLYRKWHGEEVTGDDFLMSAADMGGMEDAALENLVRSSTLVAADTALSFSRTGDFICVRFNVHSV